MDGADVDDPAPALLVHVRQRAADQPERRLQHQPQDVGEPVDGELVQRRDVLEPGVVHQDVDGEVERVDGVEVGQVDGHRGAADLGGDRLRGLGVAVDHDDRAPASASRTAQARPMPDAPPVISARRPTSDPVGAMAATVGGRAPRTARAPATQHSRRCGLAHSVSCRQAPGSADDIVPTHGRGHVGRARDGQSQATASPGTQPPTRRSSMSAPAQPRAGFGRSSARASSAPRSSGTTSSSTARPPRSSSPRSSSPSSRSSPAPCCRSAPTPSASPPGRSAPWSSATSATGSAARSCWSSPC